MEREYIFWRTGAGCCVFVIGNVVAVWVVVALLPWLPRHPLAVVHIYRDGTLLVKWNLDRGWPIRGRPSDRMIRLIRELKTEGRL